MIKLNGKTLRIVQGDTGPLTVNVTAATFGSSDRVQLTVTDKQKTIKLQKVAGFTNNAAVFEFANADTADLEAGVYLWELRFVKGATVSGNAITAGTDIDTPFDEPMPMRIIEALGDIGATTGGT